MYNDDNNSDDNNKFQFPPEWEGVALSKNPLRMANTLYDNLKKQKHSGIIPHPDTIKYIIHTLKSILYREYEWDIEQLDELEKKFKELNKYYPTSQPPGTKEVILPNIPMLDDILQKNELPNIFLGLISVDNNYKKLVKQMNPELFSDGKHNNNFSSEKKENTLEKNSKWIIVKSIIKIVFKIVVYWLALIGIFTLLGV